MPEAFDIAIVGGGIVGAALAHTIGGRARVVVIERETAWGYHATGRSAAEFTLRFHSDMVGRLTRASAGFLHAPPEGFCDVPLLRRSGNMLIASADKADRARSVFAAETRATGPDQSAPIWLDRAAMLARVPFLDPDRVAAAFFDPDCRDMDVDALLQAFLRSARRAGARLLSGTALEAARFHSGQWVLETTAGEVRAGRVVNAAGAWADEVAGLFGAGPLGLVPHRRTAIAQRSGDAVSRDIGLEEAGQPGPVDRPAARAMGATVGGAAAPGGVSVRTRILLWRFPLRSAPRALSLATILPAMASCSAMRARRGAVCSSTRNGSWEAIGLWPAKPASTRPASSKARARKLSSSSAWRRAGMVRRDSSRRSPLSASAVGSSMFSRLGWLRPGSRMTWEPAFPARPTEPVDLRIQPLRRDLVEAPELGHDARPDLAGAVSERLDRLQVLAASGPGDGRVHSVATTLDATAHRANPLKRRGRKQAGRQDPDRNRRHGGESRLSSRIGRRARFRATFGPSATDSRVGSLPSAGGCAPDPPHPSPTGASAPGRPGSPRAGRCPGARTAPAGDPEPHRPLARHTSPCPAAGARPGRAMACGRPGRAMPAHPAHRHIFHIGPLALRGFRLAGSIHLRSALDTWMSRETGGSSRRLPPDPCNPCDRGIRVRKCGAAASVRPGSRRLPGQPSSRPDRGAGGSDRPGCPARGTCEVTAAVRG